MTAGHPSTIPIPSKCSSSATTMVSGFCCGGGGDEPGNGAETVCVCSRPVSGYGTSGAETAECEHCTNHWSVVTVNPIFMIQIFVDMQESHLWPPLMML